MSLDESLIAHVIRHERGLTELQQAGISAEHFVDEYRTVWRYLLRAKRDHDTVPGEDTLLLRFPNLSLPNTRKSELPILVADVKKRYRYIRFLTALNDAATSINSFDEVDEATNALMGQLNSLTNEGSENHIVDLFGREARKKIIEELTRRRRKATIGVHTGLDTFDRVVGGLQKQKMYTVIGRPGLGKSWLDLLFMAMAVMDGEKIILYPLEMNLYDTASRLFSIFSQRMFGMTRTMKNLDMTRGRISPIKLRRFLNTMQEQFEGRLLVADMASLSDPYTMERIEAEVEMYKPDGIWIDYITLVKPAGGRLEEDGWGAVRQLSNSAATIAKRRNIYVGVSAQVNRESVKGNSFLPRLENIAYGDSIGQDTDVCVSINRKEEFLYYAVVKNRGGPEIGKTKVRFDVNIGHIVEVPDDDEGDDD